MSRSQPFREVASRPLRLQSLSLSLATHHKAPQASLAGGKGVDLTAAPSQIRKLGVEGMGRAVLILKVGELNGCHLLCFEEFQVKEMGKRGHSIGQVQRNSDTLEQCMGKGKQIGWSVPAGWPRDVKR